MKEIVGKSKEKLTSDLKEYYDKLWQLQVDLQSGKVKNVGEIKQIKKNIARILTVLHTKS